MSDESATRPLPPALWIALALIAVVGVGAIATQRGSSPQAQAPHDGVVRGAELSTAVPGFACFSADSLARLRQLAPDRQASALYLMTNSGCRSLPAHTAMLVEDVDANIVKARPIGDPRSVYLYRYTFTPSPATP